MNNLNSVLLEGNLTRDPEVKYTNSGTAVCAFSIATNRSFKKGEEWEKEVSFFDCETWGKLAENCGRLEKGRGVRVVGRLKQNRWTTTEGKAQSKIIVVAEHVEFKPVTKSGETQAADVPAREDEGIPF
jgi:single-strand DNA-binding protein